MEWFLIDGRIVIILLNCNPLQAPSHLLVLQGRLGHIVEDLVDALDEHA
jgi:hypothetical protein